MTITYKECFFAPSEALVDELGRGNLYKKVDGKMIKILAVADLYTCVMRENVHFKKDDNNVK